MFISPDGSSGVPIYRQLMEQVRHLIGTGALAPGERLPGIRRLAEELVMNPNTVAKAYRELERDGVLVLRHGAGAFVAEDAPPLDRTALLEEAQPIVRRMVERMRELGATEAEVQRLVRSELIRSRGRKAKART